MKILLVEDSLQLNKALSTVLKRNSYIVDSAFDGEEALLFLKQYTYDAVILDIMLPKVNGLEVLKIARSNKLETPIIMLTAKSTTEDKIHGLDLGADDYLPKPFSVDELLARLRALMRRKPVYDEESKEVFGDLTLDTSSLVLSREEEKVTLMNKEFQIMELLMVNPGQVISTERFLEKVWGYEYLGETNVVDVYVRYLRNKIDEDHEKKLLHTVRGVGYVLKEET